VPALGAISRIKPEKGKPYVLTTIEYPRSPATEAFRTLRTNLEFTSVDKPLRSILITSAVPGEGKTTVSSNLAVVFAQAGKRVMLLDADLRRPGVHRAFALPNAFGLTNLLRTDGHITENVLHRVQPNLRVMTTGALPPNPAELLGSQRMRQIIREALAACDVLIIDSPPLQVVTDAAVLSAEVDGTLLVVDSGRTRKGAVRQAREALNRVGANVLGVVVNRLSARSGQYYYYQYYGAYYGRQDPAATPETRA
jgi:capsular exopolysaccharide synthesis family protein